MTPEQLATLKGLMLSIESGQWVVPYDTKFDPQQILELFDHIEEQDEEIARLKNKHTFRLADSEHDCPWPKDQFHEGCCLDLGAFFV